jgi:hypothetical protein
MLIFEKIKPRPMNRPRRGAVEPDACCRPENLSDTRGQTLLHVGACRVAKHAFFLAKLRLEQERILPRERIATLCACHQSDPSTLWKSLSGRLPGRSNSLVSQNFENVNFNRKYVASTAPMR